MTPDAYLSLLQAPLPSGFLFMRTAARRRRRRRATIRSVTARRSIADLPVVNVKTMGNRFGDATWRTRLSADLLGLFAGAGAAAGGDRVVRRDGAGRRAAHA